MTLKKRVLVVDDDLDQRLLARRTLVRNLNLLVDCAATAIEALDYVKERTYDLVLTDLDMPEMDGQTFFETLAEKYPTLPVVVLTGRPTLDSFRSGVKMKISDFLTKPITKAELTRRIEDVLKTQSPAGQASALETTLAEVIASSTQLVQAADGFCRGEGPDDGQMKQHLDQLKAHDKALQRLQASLVSDWTD